MVLYSQIFIIQYLNRNNIFTRGIYKCKFLNYNCFSNCQNHNKLITVNIILSIIYYVLKTLINTWAQA